MTRFLSTGTPTLTDTSTGGRLFLARASDLLHFQEGHTTHPRRRHTHAYPHFYRKTYFPAACLLIIVSPGGPYHASSPRAHLRQPNRQQFFPSCAPAACSISRRSHAKLPLHWHGYTLRR